MRAPGRTSEGITNRIVSRAAIAGATLLVTLAGATAAQASPEQRTFKTAASAAPVSALDRVLLAEREHRLANPPASRTAAERMAAARRHRQAAARRAAAIRAARRAAVLRFAWAQIGDPYVFGASGPGAWDCSGLTLGAYRRAGIRMRHSAATQGGRGWRVSRRNARPGDLVVWGSYHVGIYVGRGRVLHSPAPGQRVKVERIWGNPQFRRLPRLR